MESGEKKTAAITLKVQPSIKHEMERAAALDGRNLSNFILELFRRFKRTDK